MAPAASFRNVCKDYAFGPFGRGRLTAVRDVTFDVRPGEALGLVGPNRAGKTTLIKMLLSLSRVSSGALARLGAPARDRRTLARVGYMHENQAFPRYLSARALLRFYGVLAFMAEDRIRRRSDELLGLVGLADRADEPISRFSKGMVQRLALAQALLNEPDLLVLDEPMEGLDLDGRRLLRDSAKALVAAGRSVLFVSHSLLDVEELCSRLVIIYEGRLRYDGDLKSFLESAGAPPRSLERTLQDFYRKQAT